MATDQRATRRSAKAEKSRATRERIIAAATSLFVESGYLSSTMAAIAKEAGVAVQTLYLSFGSKPAILKAVFNTALAGADSADGILEQEWVTEVISDPDGPTALRRFCAHSGEIISRAAPVFNVMRMAGADPDVAGLLDENKQLRTRSFGMVRDALVTRPGFSPTLSPHDALGVLYAVVSEDSYILLVHEYGWTCERWIEWITETAVAQLFPHATRPA